MSTAPARSLTSPLNLSKFTFFLIFAAAAAVLPFLTLYYESLGLSGRQIGMLAGLPPLVMLFTASIWSGLADATQRHKLVMAVAMLGLAGSGLLFLLVDSFWALVPVVILYAFCFGPVEPLLSNTALELLRGRTEQYGKVRLWGALGWGLLAPLFGQLVEQYGRTSSFYIHGLLILIGLLVALRLPKPSRAATDTKFSQGLRRLLADRRWWWFLLIVLVGGIAESMVHNFWFIYLKSLGASGALMGFSMTIAMVSELLVFFYADRLLKRFGPRRMLIFGVSMHLIRLVAFSVIQQPYLAILFQLLHGPAYAVIWTAAVAQANRLAPEGLGATAQGLLTSVSFGMALSVGALLGGFLYEQVGIFATYRWMALLVLAGLTAFIVGSRAHTATVRPATRPVEVISY